MQHTPGTETPRPEDPLAELRNTAGGPSEPAARAIRRALALVEKDDSPDPAGLEIDRAVLTAVRQARDPEAVLGLLPMPALAALSDRFLARLEAAGQPCSVELRRPSWEVLDLLRRSAVLRRIAADEIPAWSERILSLVERSDLTAGPLFRMRVETYGSKPLFKIPAKGGTRSLSWRQVAARVDTLARGLLSLAEDGEEQRVAILSDNRIESALVDLACLTSGIMDVPVPANATEADVGYIVNHAGIGTVVVSGREQLRKVLANREQLPHLRHIVVIDAEDATDNSIMTLDAVASRASRIDPQELEERSLATRIDDRATIMYTSGTTGTPKGIQFSHRNIVFKRFARAMALPEIGEDDVFLCYLPLFHTFGRYFEMFGCVFWGSTYCFLDNPSAEALIAGMKEHRPTVFISVPKKWIQLYEAVVRQADPDKVDDDEVRDAALRVTGGRLRWGLSAAGHLDSEIFRFFQRYGTELVSGFGMTEATGGISMTPPGSYKDGSLGPPLPGIEARLADDGELLVRGPYVMMGYFDPPGGESSFDEDGWMHSGDLMQRDQDGHLYLVDRKKEIYKNIKGETIAPQRIENLFRDFESVGRVFLVGDHREFNAALIHPHPDYERENLASLSPSEVKDHFRSVVVSVNKFLAPYERIVDFAVIDRDLDAERGELTPKGTPKRKVVEENFQPVIRLLYRRTNFQVGDVELTIPNWLFQSLGLTAQDIRVEGDEIVMPTRATSLIVRAVDDSTARVGSCLYRHRKGPINLGDILSTPRLWLGNEALVDFVDLDLRSRERSGVSRSRLMWAGRVEPPRPGATLKEDLEHAQTRPEPGLLDLHLAAQALEVADDPETSAGAIRILENAVGEEDGRLAESARWILGRAAASESLDVRRRAFQVLVPAERIPRFEAMLRAFLAPPGILLDEETRGLLCERDLPAAKIESFVHATDEVCRSPDWTADQARRVASLLGFLADYGAAHPTRYRRIRVFLVRMTLFCDQEGVREAATQAAEALRQGFRRWLGPTQRIAVDPETGHEYRAEEVVAFEPQIEAEDRQRLLAAIRNTSFLREAVFLFTGGSTVRLSDIPPGGVSVRLLGTRSGKSVYRITVQTRHQETYEVAANLNHDLTPQEVREEIQWLILCGEPEPDRDALVEDFGGYWEEQDLWSEEFIPGENLDRGLRRLQRHADDSERVRHSWLFFAWSALSTFVGFWDRTGRRWESSDPSPGSVIVPSFDYLTGARLVSLSARKPFSGLLSMIRLFRARFVEPVEQKYPVLAGIVGWSVLFSAVLEVIGEEDGVTMFREALQNDGQDLPADMRDALSGFLDTVEARGFLPMRLYFAAQRYRRWLRLSEDATPQARARTMREFYDTYGIQRLIAKYPEARVRFFRETVFEDAPTPLIEGLETIIKQLRVGELIGDALVDAISDLRAHLELGEGEDYFLARLSFPHLRPEDSAGFVHTDFGGRHQSEVVVRLEDHEGNPFVIRHALNPKEVGRLHRLFLDANLDVHFRPEHQYLVAINDRVQLIGGIFYEMEEDGRSTHLEKIVVAERYRQLGVANALMNELFNRLRAAGVETVTTGFFRPEYFYSYGFKIEKRYAGLVKNLTEDPPE